MDIQARINELTQQQQALLQRTQEDGVNIQRLAGAIAILTEQLAEDVEVPQSEEADREEIVMPKVGQKHYPYTAKGKAQAKVAAKRKGTTVKYGKKRSR